MWKVGSEGEERERDEKGKRGGWVGDGKGKGKGRGEGVKAYPSLTMASLPEVRGVAPLTSGTRPFFFC